MKKILYVILALVLVYIVLALFGAKDYKVERSISVNKPILLVASKLTDFKYFHDEWSPWSEKDPAMKNTYKGNPGEVGHFYSWQGNKEVGNGEMEIKSITKDSIVQRLTFEGMGDSKAYYILKDNATSTDVTWGMMFDVGFFARPIMMFMNMDKMLGADYEKGLAKFKTKVEAIKEEMTMSNHEVKEIQWEARTFFGTKKVKMDGMKLKDFFSENFPKQMMELDKEKVQSCMSPCGLFYSWDEKTMITECAAAMCVPEGKVLKGWEKYSIPASRVLHAPHYGDPAKSIEAHYAIDEYMKERKLDYTFVIEEYVTNPMETDTTKWLTNIYYILK